MEPQIIAPKKKLNLVWIIAGFIVAVAVGLRATHLFRLMTYHLLLLLPIGKLTVVKRTGMSLNIHRIGMSVKECLVPYVLKVAQIYWK